MKRVYALLRVIGWGCMVAASLVALFADGRFTGKSLALVATLYALWLATAFLPRR